MSKIKKISLINFTAALITAIYCVANHKYQPTDISGVGFIVGTIIFIIGIIIKNDSHYSVGHTDHGPNESREAMSKFWGGALVMFAAACWMVLVVAVALLVNRHA